MVDTPHHILPDDPKDPFLVAVFHTYLLEAEAWESRDSIHVAVVDEDEARRVPTCCIQALPVHHTAHIDHLEAVDCRNMDLLLLSFAWVLDLTMTWSYFFPSIACAS